MGTLVVNPRPDIFSQVPLFHEVFEEFQARGALKLIANVGKIFVKHNVCDKYGISMAHRHFEMSENEILVESIKADKTLSVFVPWNVFSSKYAEPVDVTLLSAHGIEKPVGKFVLPQNWVFGSSGEAIPFEYFETSDKTMLTLPPPEFVRELYIDLKALGVEHLVGLRSIETKGDTNTWETTPENLRANVVVHGDMPKDMELDKMVKVLWVFDHNGKIKEGNADCYACWCSSHCSGHCSGCTC